MKWLILTTCLLAACSAAPVAPEVRPSQPAEAAGVFPAADAPTPTYGLAGQGVFLAGTTAAQQRTQTSFEAAIAEATDAARATEGAAASAGTQAAASSTARAGDLQFNQTASAATQTARETELAFSITLDAATSEADATQAAAVVVATASSEDRVRQASSEATAWWFWSGFGVLLAAIVLWYAVQVGRGLARRADPRHDPNTVRVIRTSLGPVLIIPLASGGFSKELLLQPAGQQNKAPHAADESEFETDEEAIAEAEEAPVYAGGRLTGFYNRAQSRRSYEQDEANRRFMLWFVRKCIEVAGREGSTIPPHDRLKVATETWARATDMLGSQIEKRRGRNGGTWLTGEYATLADLWLAVGERRFVPRQGAGRVVVEHSPAPAESAVAG